MMNIPACLRGSRSKKLGVKAKCNFRQSDKKHDDCSAVFTCLTSVSLRGYGRLTDEVVLED